MERDLHAAAQRQTKRRDHDRLGRVLEGHIGVLEGAHGLVNLLPLLFLRAHEQKHEVGSDAEIRALVANHHGVETFVERFEPGVDHLHRVRANRVHLGVELETDHAVAQIDEAGAGVPLDLFLARFERGQQQDSGPILQRAIIAAGEIEERSRAVGLNVESPLTGAYQFFHESRNRAILGLPPLDGRLHAHRIPEFEDAAFPVETPLHNVINGDDVVGDFRNAAGGVMESCGKKFAIKLTDAVA